MSADQTVFGRRNAAFTQIATIPATHSNNAVVPTHVSVSLSSNPLIHTILSEPTEKHTRHPNPPTTIHRTSRFSRQQQVCEHHTAQWKQAAGWWKHTAVSGRLSLDRALDALLAEERAQPADPFSAEGTAQLKAACTAGPGQPVGAAQLERLALALVEAEEGPSARLLGCIVMEVTMGSLVRTRQIACVPEIYQQIASIIATDPTVATEFLWWAIGVVEAAAAPAPVAAAVDALTPVVAHILGLAVAAATDSYPEGMDPLSARRTLMEAQPGSKLGSVAFQALNFLKNLPVWDPPAPCLMMMQERCLRLAIKVLQNATAREHIYLRGAAAQAVGTLALKCALANPRQDRAPRLDTQRALTRALARDGPGVKHCSAHAHAGTCVHQDAGCPVRCLKLSHLVQAGVLLWEGFCVI